MLALPTDEWTAALDQMSRAIAGQLDELDARQAAESSPEVERPASRPVELLTWMEHRLLEWDERLIAAAALARSVEQHLGERETALGRWHQHFVMWRDLIQKPVSAADTSLGAHGPR